MSARSLLLFLPLALAVALSAAGQEFDLYTPPLQALKADYKKATADAAKVREDALREMVRKHLRIPVKADTDSGIRPDSC
ncbi:MAG: hypothetical protein QME60_06765, partial [Verrucomicrobiota bacterium]|nr:hypothetical protein [Verrucomicrobiota bacterium]